MANFFLTVHTSRHGYEEIGVPNLVNRATMTGTGQLPKFEHDLFKSGVTDRELFLIPTAEVPLTNLHAEEILPAEDLPYAYTAWTPCFRSEAGSYGRDARGILRLHQFAKVEMVRFCRSEDSCYELEIMVGHSETCLKELGLAYRVVKPPPETSVSAPRSPTTLRSGYPARTPTVRSARVPTPAPSKLARPASGRRRKTASVASLPPSTDPGFRSAGPWPSCWKWLAQEADGLGLDRDRLLLMGMSGGGGLAASCALMAHDRLGLGLRGQLLMYPMLDDRNDTPSAYQMMDVGIWRQADNDYAWRQVLGQNAGTDAVDYRAAAARADSLAGLPPAYLDVGSAETFRDEVVDFARRIWLAGEAADLHVWDGAFHGFDLVAPESRLGAASWRTKSDWVSRRIPN